MKRFLLAFALLFASTAPSSVSSQTSLNTVSDVHRMVVAQTCCDATELRTIADLNYITRVTLKHTGDVSDRLYVMNQIITTANWRSWSDPDRGLLLGYIAATPDGKYWRPLLERFATVFGVTIKNVTLSIPAPTPAPLPSPVVPPAQRASGSIDSLVRIIVKEELAKTVGAGSAVGQTVTGDLTVLGRVCVGGPCLAEFGHRLQLRDGGAAEILLSSNEDGSSPQFGVRRGISTISGGGDLGLRLIHNSAWRPDGTMVWGDSLRPQTILAFDSQGTLSISQDRYGYPREKSQAMVLVQDYNRRYIGWTSMRAGWNHCIGWSTTINDFANLWCPDAGNR